MWRGCAFMDIDLDSVVVCNPTRSALLRDLEYILEHKVTQGEILMLQMVEETERRIRRERYRGPRAKEAFYGKTLALVLYSLEMFEGKDPHDRPVQYWNTSEMLPSALIRYEHDQQFYNKVRSIHAMLMQEADLYLEEQRDATSD
jgi:hypothetical protein